MGFQAFPINSFHKCPLRAYAVPGTAQGSECTKMQRMWPHSMRSSQGRGDRCVHSHALCEKCFNGRTIRVLWKQSWELMTKIGTSKEEREKGHWGKFWRMKWWVGKIKSGIPARGKRGCMWWGQELFWEKDRYQPCRTRGESESRKAKSWAYIISWTYAR